MSSNDREGEGRGGGRDRQSEGGNIYNLIMFISEFSYRK